MKNGSRPRNDLKAKLVSLGISQVELAERLDMASGHLNAVLNGRSPLRGQLARLLAQELGISVEEVMEGAR